MKTKTISELYFKPIRDVPKIDVGAPCPMVLASEGILVVAYYMPYQNDDDHGNTLGEPREFCAAIIFDSYRDFRSGYPDEHFYYNNEDISPFPEAYEFSESNMLNWVTDMGCSNPLKVLPDNSLKHFIFAFHDSTVEVMAKEYRVDQAECTVSEMIQKHLNKTVK